MIPQLFIESLTGVNTNIATASSASVTLTAIDILATFLPSNSMVPDFALCCVLRIIVITKTTTTNFVARAVVSRGV